MTRELGLKHDGEAFLQELNSVLKPLSVNRLAHSVRFFMEKNKFSTDSCEVSLLEEDVRQDWGDAVEWIESKIDAAPRAPRIYAMIEERDDR